MADFFFLSNITLYSTPQTLMAHEVGVVGAGATFVVTAPSDSTAPYPAVILLGSGANFHNYGTTIASGMSSVAVESQTQYGVVLNYGAMFGGYGAIAGFPGAGGASIVIRNEGTITASFGPAIALASGGNEIVNLGEISSLTASAIVMTDASATFASNQIINHGSVMAGGTGTLAISLSANDDEIINTGFISGGIALGGGGNHLLNTGMIVGDVTGGAGSDVFDLRGGLVRNGAVQGLGGGDFYYIDDATVMIEEASRAGNDTVISSVSFALPSNVERLELTGSEDLTGNGNSLSNTVTGNGGSNRLRGEGGNDVIDGRGGDDLLVGGTGLDRLDGGDGDDVIRGQADGDTAAGGEGDDLIEGGTGNDTLAGDNGNDQLSGGKGADTLSGGAGEDVIVGGWGADRMTGEADADRFVFETRRDSATGAASDLILDFVPGEDLIDLSAIDANPTTAADDAFLLTFTTPQPGALPTEVYVVRNLDTNQATVRVIASVSETGTISWMNIRVQMTDVTDLSESDFIL